jgi:hypothetical protein
LDAGNGNGRLRPKFDQDFVINKILTVVFFGHSPDGWVLACRRSNQRFSGRVENPENFTNMNEN